MGRRGRRPGGERRPSGRGTLRRWNLFPLFSRGWDICLVKLDFQTWIVGPARDHERQQYDAKYDQSSGHVPLQYQDNPVGKSRTADNSTD